MGVTNRLQPTDESKAMTDQLQNRAGWTEHEVSLLLQNPESHVSERHVGDGRHRPEALNSRVPKWASAFPDEGVLHTILADALNSADGQTALNLIMTGPENKQDFKFPVTDIDIFVVPGTIHDIADRSVPRKFTGDVTVVLGKNGTNRFLMTAFPN